jgi:4-diphosphocytidyl-2-C-methyl-D-erythritol kinase
MTALSEAAPAKLNLALHLRRRRPDGYHDLETVFAFTDFGDVLSVEPADAVSLAVDGPWAASAGSIGDNLVLRAAHALAAAAGVAKGAALRLEKHIPVAAGLGGGSADAAAALRLLNRFWALDWPEAQLMAVAAGLGADVPACLASRTCFGAERGELLSDWPEPMSGRPVLLVNPRVPVPTGPVFAGWDQQDRGGIERGAPLAMLRNDMTASAVRIAHAVGEVLDVLSRAAAGALVRMSGSGGTCFALFEQVQARDEALVRLEPELRSRGWWWMAAALR